MSDRSRRQPHPSGGVQGESPREAAFAVLRLTCDNDHFSTVSLRRFDRSGSMCYHRRRLWPVVSSQPTTCTIAGDNQGSCAGRTRCHCRRAPFGGFISSIRLCRVSLLHVESLSGSSPPTSQLARLRGITSLPGPDVKQDDQPSLWYGPRPLGSKVALAVGKAGSMGAGA